MSMIRVQALGTQHRGELVAFFTVIAQQESLGREIFETDRLLTAEAVRATEDHVKRFVEQFPTVETIPSLANRGADSQLGITSFQKFNDLRSRTPEDFQFDFTETFSQFIDVRQNKAKLDAAGYGQLQRADLAVVDHGG